MLSENCWVWFKKSLNKKGYWHAGFSCSRDEKPGVLIQSPSFVSCRVPEWRVSSIEPLDLYKGPDIPTDAAWKLPV
tara:strand:- start:707 stop:934 length:228 start_codon:yes stop_codon:yes gene_type:complete